MAFWGNIYMTETIITFFRELTGNDYLTLFIISIIPIVELRGAIIFMGGMEGINMIAGMFCCVAGSSVMIIPIILLIRPLIRKLKRSKLFSKFGKRMEENLADRAPEVSGENENVIKKKMSLDLKKFWGTFIFVAIPLPMTGSWTGSAIAGILDFKLWKAALGVFLGNVVAAGILTVIVALVPAQYTDFVLYAFIILAVALCVILYFTRSSKRERKEAKEKDKYGNRSLYELAKLEEEANENGEVLIKKEYVDDEGNKHIVVGNDETRNKQVFDDHSEI